jgi:hypothetical protein
MPSKAQFEELINSRYTTKEWTTLNGVKGRKITSKKNGNSIFLPAAGYRRDSSLNNTGSGSSYWSRTLGAGFSAEGLGLYAGSFNISMYERRVGQTVRAVAFKQP